MMKQKTLLLILAAIIIAGSAHAVTNITAQLRPDYIIEVDGETQIFYNAQGVVVQPILYEGTTYLPVRAIGELMGKEVHWDGSSRTVSLLQPGTQPEESDSEEEVPQSSYIGTNAAKDIALAAAGLNQAAVDGLRCWFAFDHDREVYDAEFTHEGTRYTFTIDARSGVILQELSVEI